MIKQTLLFSNPAFLSLKLKQLVIDTKSERGILTRPLEDIGLIVIETPCVTLTSALLAELTARNIAVMICDSKHMPSGLLQPLEGNTLLSQKSRAQLAASLPLKKQLWQQTVMAKIRNQACVLRAHRQCETGCMEQWSKTVRSGDPDNLEARAAVYYWKNLFAADGVFFRGDDDNPVNSLLDYGYAILRAVVARAIVGSGLIPQCGLFHRNKFNAFCLADDVMEPYRPYVDSLVCNMISRDVRIVGLTPEIKRDLLSVPVLDVTIGGLRRPLMVAVATTAASLAKCYEGEARKIVYPEM